MTFDEWWQIPYGALDIVSASGSVNVKMIAKGAWNAALQSHNSAMDAIKAVCERTDPHETDVEVLRVTINKIYAALTMHHGADAVRKG